jgi:DNA helicase-2/ATP-dependent DNA helicase PcrA|tara:strand:+ start:9301 stop:11451 length:2151 start_codon:yes stop_codon:yes gene_type:complete
MDVTSIIDSLNDAQRNAVCAESGNQLILAGAGSGKTRVLVHRIAWLMQTEKVSPYSIMAVTFTNKSAKEMRNRIEDLQGSSLRGMWVGTFHGLAHRLLKSHWLDAGLPENFQILDSDDQLRVVKRVTRALDLDDSQWPPRQSQWFINSQKDEGKRAAHIDDWGDLHHKTMVRIYQHYEELCQRGGLVDFGELLLRSHELWLKKPAILEHYQQRFSHLLVDEFQDTNAVQYAWLRVLAGNNCKVTAVGDDDQSIYGWRGAKIENIQRFSEDFPDTQITKLEQNYRSTETILQAANEVISRNQGRLGKELWTAGEKGEKISLYAGFNEVDEANFIVEQIQQASQEVAKSDCAILYRSNAQSRVLEDSLLRAGVPYRVYGGHRFYERLEIKNALSYLRLLNNPHDDIAFERVINTPTRGIGAKSVENLRLFAREHGASLWQSASTMVEKNILPARAASNISNFLQLLADLTEGTNELPLHEQVDHIIDASGLLEFHRNEKGEKSQARVENLQELVVATRAFAWDEDENGTPLQQFLDTAALDAGDAQADEFEDAVQLMTLHSAKGLEFHTVFIAGVEENLFPHKMSAEDPERLEEERRLCYVGITRAMVKLYISYAECRRLYGSDNFNAPSRFLREIPPECLQEVRLGAQITRPVLFGAPDETEPQQGISLGGRVFHQVFGEGTVLNVEGHGDNARVQVNFDNEGSKWLVLQYAGLQAI